jgi:hypothetical protein
VSASLLVTAVLVVSEWDNKPGIVHSIPLLILIGLIGCVVQMASEQGSVDDYVLPATEQPVAKVEGNMNRREALEHLQKDAGLTCCDLLYYYFLRIIIGLLFSLFRGLPEIADLIISVYMIMEFGTTLLGRISGYHLISVNTFQPWQSVFGFIIYGFVNVFCTLIPCLVLPGCCCCCCGAPYQSFVDGLFDVMWVKTKEYEHFMEANKERIAHFAKEREPKQNSTQFMTAVVLALIVVVLAMHAQQEQLHAQQEQLHAQQEQLQYLNMGIGLLQSLGNWLAKKNEYLKMGIGLLQSLGNWVATKNQDLLNEFLIDMSRTV